jgi:serine/threonine-protein kinase
VNVLVVAAHVPGFESGWGAEHSARVLSGIPGNVVTRLMRSSRPSFSLSEVESEEGKVLPLHVDQMVRYALEVGGEPPARLGDLIAQRVDLLEPSARLALQALAVLGDRVETELLAQMLPDTHRLDVTLGLLSRSGMIVREKELVSASHPLLREVVLAGIPATARRDLHAKALAVFERRSAPLEARAQHAYRSQDSFQALLLLEQIATRAARRADTDTEVLALRRALEIARIELSKGELDDPLQAILIFGRKLGSALTRAGDFADAEGVLREALDVAGPSGTERARVLGVLAEVAQARKRRAEAIEYIEEAIETARQSGAHELVGSLTAARAGWGS